MDRVIIHMENSEIICQKLRVFWVCGDKKD
jgi:hypothetical protein